MRRIWVPAILLIVAACAPTTRPPSISAVDTAREIETQKRLTLETHAEDARFAYSIAGDLMMRLHDMCGEDVGPTLGLAGVTQNDLDAGWRDAAEDVYNLRGDYPSVFVVVPGSPADKAGVRVGDRIIAANQMDLRFTESALALRDRLTREAEKGPVTLTLDRGERIDLAVGSVPICKYNVRLLRQDAVNAFADGKGIYITTGLLRFLRNEDELRYIFAHELAHNTMGHVDKKVANAVIGGAAGLVLDVLAAAGGVNTQGVFMRTFSNVGALAYSQGFEAEADYVGTYMLARAGYEIDAVPNVWRRMASRTPQAIEIARTHPTTPERFVALTKTIEEIKRKQAAGQPLEPEAKEYDEEFVVDDETTSDR